MKRLTSDPLRGSSFDISRVTRLTWLDIGILLGKYKVVNQGESFEKTFLALKYRYLLKHKSSNLERNWFGTLMCYLVIRGSY